MMPDEPDFGQLPALKEIDLALETSKLVVCFMPKLIRSAMSEYLYQVRVPWSNASVHVPKRAGKNALGMLVECPALRGQPHCVGVASGSGCVLVISDLQLLHSFSSKSDGYFAASRACIKQPPAAPFRRDDASVGVVVKFPNGLERVTALCHVNRDRARITVADV